MRLHLYRRNDMREYVAWLYSCIILHNILAKLGDQWAEMANENSNSLPASPAFPTEDNEDGDSFRKRLTIECVKFNYQKGVLPI
ncbi:hypothetical protein PGT21_029319 [Puccinia graminis f. sp. tritici]|uniref:DDE Tnp4 domain-containing protein n=1 Tax=Puccinia graminis f. sp. tritici TaxID=56615 RepID=A0A5B0MQC7_PUCGR|nr:hypothetical protein PGT21_029319 [Puccinia graminis f. sp. tritici]